MTSNTVKDFATLFSGLRKAYGSYAPEEGNGVGKEKGRYRIISEDIDDLRLQELWKNHLEGRNSLGIIPITETNTCTWGAIDIDQYPLNHGDLVTKFIKTNKLPFVVARSKSGGAHIFVFLSEPVSCAIVQHKLKDIASVLGYATAEIFPKQTKLLLEKGDRGSTLNMPYFGGKRTTRYAHDDTGIAITDLDEFIEYAKQKTITKAKLESLKIISADIADKDLEGAPPCLKILCSMGFPEGTKCNDQPIASHCNAAVCRTCEYGVGSSGGLPQFSNLQKQDSTPPIWFLDVEGHRIELTTDELQNQTKFQRRCMDELNFMPLTMRQNNWRTVVQQLLDSVSIIEVPEDVSVHGQFKELLESFCTERAQAQSRDELLLGKPWTEESKTFFRLKDLIDYFSRQQFRDYGRNHIAARLRELGGGDHFFHVKGKGVTVWYVPEFKSQDESYELPNMGEDPF